MQKKKNLLIKHLLLAESCVDLAVMQHEVSFILVLMPKAYDVRLHFKRRAAISNCLKHSDIKHYRTKYYLNALRAPEKMAL